MIYVLGGGNDLNFKVVGGTTQPSNPKENTIWVNTSTEITNWYMGDYSAPTWSEPDGLVIIYARTTNSSGFNAFSVIKKNSIWLSPIRAFQYVNGVWTAKTTKIYKNGAWSAFWTGELYTAGNTWDSITGGYYRLARASSDVSSISPSAPTVTYGTSSVTVDGTNKAGVWFAQNPIDLTNFTKVTCKGTFTRGGDYARNLGIGVWKASIPTYYYTNASAFNGVGSATGQTSVSLNISDLSGDYFVGIGLTNSKAVVTEFVLA